MKVTRECTHPDSANTRKKNSRLDRSFSGGQLLYDLIQRSHLAVILFSSY
jgi:hypothetical protein